MPRKRPTPRLQHRQPGLRGGQGDKGTRVRDGQSPGSRAAGPGSGEPGTAQGGGCWGIAQAGPSREGYWHHPGTLGKGTWGTGVQETRLMPGNPLASPA